MIEVIPARPEMAASLDLQEVQQLTGLAATPENLAQFIQAGPAFACVDGSVLAILGVFPVWHERSVAWGLLSRSIGASMLPIHRAVLRGLDELFTARRVEAYVAAGHRAGFRWMGLLGFEYEGMMKSFYGTQDFALFARIRR